MISSELLLETPVEQLEAIARRFKELRLAANMRQADLAERSGVGIATIRRFEAGAREELNPFQAGQMPAHHLPRLMRRGVPRPHFSRAVLTSAAWLTRTPEKMKCPPDLSFFTRPGAEAMRSSL